MHKVYSSLKGHGVFNFSGCCISIDDQIYYPDDYYYRAQINNTGCGDCVEYTYSSGEQDIYGDGFDCGLGSGNGIGKSITFEDLIENLILEEVF